tara:strand:+ start:277 stop:465 length:189 start_codon:yes stop_codon:yes gene_type:complete
MSLDSENLNCSLNFRRKKFYKRKMSILTYVKDSLERKLASVKAAIQTLEQQIEREERTNTTA